MSRYYPHTSLRAAGSFSVACSPDCARGLITARPHELDRDADPVFGPPVLPFTYCVHCSWCGEIIDAAPLRCDRHGGSCAAHLDTLCPDDQAGCTRQVSYCPARDWSRTITGAAVAAVSRKLRGKDHDDIAWARIFAAMDADHGVYGSVSVNRVLARLGWTPHTNTE